MTRQEKERQAKLTEWAVAQRAAGKAVVSDDDYSTLYEVEVLLCLAQRRLSRNPFFRRDLHDRVLALFEETRQERAKSVSWKDFDRPDAPQPLPDLILSREEEHTS